jgi:hypothetical protein
MQDKVDKSIEQMNQNFKNVAGEALRKPLLTIANQKGFLDGQTISLDQHRQVPLFPLFIKNEGDKKSGYISIRLFASEDLQLQNSGTAQRVDINDREFPFEYYFPVNEITGTSVDIAPTETWTFPNILQNWNFYQGTTNQFINCKLDLYYDSDKPSEAKFRIKTY